MLRRAGGAAGPAVGLRDPEPGSRVPPPGTRLSPPGAGSGAARSRVGAAGPTAAAAAPAPVPAAPPAARGAAPVPIHARSLRVLPVPAGLTHARPVLGGSCPVSALGTGGSRTAPPRAAPGGDPQAPAAPVPAGSYRIGTSLYRHRPPRCSLTPDQPPAPPYRVGTSRERPARSGAGGCAGSPAVPGAGTGSAVRCGGAGAAAGTAASAAPLKQRKRRRARPRGTTAVPDVTARAANGSRSGAHQRGDARKSHAPPRRGRGRLKGAAPAGPPPRGSAAPSGRNRHRNPCWKQAVQHFL